MSVAVPIIIIAAVVVMTGSLVVNGLLIAKGAHHLVRGLQSQKEPTDDHSNANNAPLQTLVLGSSRDLDRLDKYFQP